MAVSRALRDLHARHAAGLAPIWDPNEGLTVQVKVPASTMVHPKRTRCKACRTGLGDLVVLGLFCSYRCAGLPDPDENVTTAPRECKRAARSDEPGEWAFKQRFATAKDAKPYVKPGTTVYRCRNCFFLHIGNVSAPPPKGGLPPVPSGNGVFGDCVLAVLQARGQDPEKPSAVAAAKRDVRAVFEVLGVKPTSTKASRPRARRP